MPLFANVYYYMFILYFFLTNGHLSYIKLFHISYETLPIGFSGFTADVPLALVTYFSTVLTLAVKLAAPIIAIEFITEICLGVLMKAVPTIHIFALNIQLKVLIGLAAVLADGIVVDHGVHVAAADQKAQPGAEPLRAARYDGRLRRANGRRRKNRKSHPEKA